MIKSWVDLVVIVALVLLTFGAASAFVIAKQDKFWRRTWMLWGVAGFWILELTGAQSGNTLSENIVRSIPLPILVVGTPLLAVILVLHWIDLNSRIQVRKMTVLAVDWRMWLAEKVFEVSFFWLLLSRYIVQKIRLTLGFHQGDLGQT